MNDQFKETLDNVTAQAEKMRAVAAQVAQATQAAKNPPPTKAVQQGTSEAPKWLIFEDAIFNCSQVKYMERNLENSTICIALEGGTYHNIHIKNINDVWLKLQKAFAFGVTLNEHQNVPNSVQAD